VTGGGGGDMVVEGVPGNKGIRGRDDPRLTEGGSMSGHCLSRQKRKKPTKSQHKMRGAIQKWLIGIGKFQKYVDIITYLGYL